MIRTLWVAASIVFVMLAACSERGQTTGGRPYDGPRLGTWRAWLETPSGPLPFGIEFSRQDEDWSAVVVNGVERIDVDEVEYDGGELVVRFPHYDSEIRGVVRDEGGTLDGVWTKTRGVGNVAVVPFKAWHGERDRFKASSELSADAGEALAGRWRVRFADSEDDAVGVLRAEGATDGSNVQGTILTTTGDYRYLAGLAEEHRLRLSCFDGAHAFLFDAEVRDDGSLSGTFASGDWYSVAWTGVRDASVELPDMFGETSWEEEADLSAVVFRDLEGNSVRLTDEAFRDKPTLIKVTGTWCPNCNDAAPFLADLHRRYRDRGLQVVALAFELTEDFERSARQVRRFKERHGIEFDVLIAGLSDKDRASAFLPVLDRVRSYPTTIFMDADGNVRGIHTGFTGPATGEAYVEMKAEFEGLIKGMLE